MAKMICPVKVAIGDTVAIASVSVECATMDECIQKALDFVAGQRIDGFRYKPSYEPEMNQIVITAVSNKKN